MSPAGLVDIHSHILPEHIPDFGTTFGYGDFISIAAEGDDVTMLKGGTFFRRADRRIFDPDIRLAACDEAGVTTQVLSTVPVMFSYWAEPKDGAYLAAFLNDHLAGLVARFPDRFVGLATLPMQDPGLAVIELERSVALGLAGAIIGTNVNRMNLSEPRFRDVFAAASDLGASLFVHPWEMMGEADMPEYWLPWLVGMPAETSRAICSMIFGGVFESFTDLRVAFAHGGGSFPATFGRIEQGYRALPEYVGVDNPYPPSRYLGRFWIDSVVHSPTALVAAADLVGDDRVCLGTDFPFRLGEEQPGSTIRACGYPSEIEKRLLRDNALQWLGHQS